MYEEDFSLNIKGIFPLYIKRFSPLYQEDLFHKYKEDAVLLGWWHWTEIFRHRVLALLITINYNTRRHTYVQLHISIQLMWRNSRILQFCILYIWFFLSPLLLYPKYSNWTVYKSCLYCVLCEHAQDRHDTMHVMQHPHNQSLFPFKIPVKILLFYNFLK